MKDIYDNGFRDSPQEQGQEKKKRQSSKKSKYSLLGKKKDKEIQRLDKLMRTLKRDWKNKKYNSKGEERG